MPRRQPIPTDLTAEDKAKYELLRVWFYTQKYRPFINEGVQYAQDALNISISAHRLRIYINESGPPAGVKPQLWKSQSQEAGSRKGRDFQQRQALGELPPVLPTTGKRIRDRSTTWTSTKVWGGPPEHDDKPLKKPIIQADNAWDMLVRDGWLDPKIHRIPPTCMAVANSKPARKVKARPGAQNIWQTRINITPTDIAGLLLHATGVPAKRRCKCCENNKVPWDGCIVSAEDGPAASKYNKSCANCWFKNRASVCEFRPKSNKTEDGYLPDDSLQVANNKTSFSLKRRIDKALETELSFVDELQDGRSYMMATSDILPKRLKLSKNKKKLKKRLRTSILPPRLKKGWIDAGLEEAEEDSAGPQEKPSHPQGSDQVLPGPTPEQLELSVDQNVSLQLGDLGKYLDHYIRHYQHRPLDELSHALTLRNLEITAIKAVVSARKQTVKE